MKVRTAENWLKFANTYGSGLDKENAEVHLAAARDMTSGNVKAANEARLQAERLAKSGNEEGAYAALAAAFHGKSARDRRVLIARTKPSVFDIYKDPRAAIWRAWDQGGRPLSAYDRVATRFFSDNGYLPFVSEGRNNLLDLLSHLQATYATGEADIARRFCRLIPDTYSHYSQDRPPETCSTVRWSKWLLSMGDVDRAKQLLSIGLDLAEGGPPSQAASQTAIATRIEIALIEARYGSPDDFLEALDTLDAKAGSHPIPDALRFYAGILRDDPNEVRTALKSAGRFDRVEEYVGEYDGKTLDSGDRLRERLAVTGRKVAAYLCEAEVTGLPAIVRTVQCLRSGRPSLRGAPPFRSRRAEAPDGEGPRPEQDRS